MQTIARSTPYQLADAITAMVMRLAEAERGFVYTHAEAVQYSGEQRAWAASREQDRWERACTRRFKAIQRLTAALAGRAEA